MYIFETLLEIKWESQKQSKSVKIKELNSFREKFNNLNENFKNVLQRLFKQSPNRKTLKKTRS